MVVLERPEIPGERSPKMRYIQIIFSPVGGTARTAEIMTSVWSESVETVDLTDPSLDFSKYSFEKEDTVLVAMRFLWRQSAGAGGSAAVPHKR